MIAETCVQGGALILLLWAVLRLLPSVPPSVQVWLWRLVFLKLALGLWGVAVLPLQLLPPEPQVAARAVEVTPIQEGAPTAAVSWWAIAYAAGLAAIVLRSAWGLGKAHRLVVHSVPVEDPGINQILDLILRRAKVGRRPRLLASTEVSTPILVGGLRASIVLPWDSPTHCTTEELGLMIAHEVAHIARKDLFWTLFQTSIHAPLFFHPLVWLGARASNLARESAADQMALCLTGCKPRVYGEMLLRAAVVGRSGMSAGPAGVAMVESYRTVQRRLQTMQHFNRKPSVLRGATSLGLLALTLALVPTFQLVAQVAPPPQAGANVPALPRQNVTVAKPPQASVSRPAAATTTRSRQTRPSRSRATTVRATVGRPVTPVAVRATNAGQIPALAPVAGTARTVPARPPQTRGVPFLKDLPIVGPLFQLKDNPPQPVVSQGTATARPAGAPTVSGGTAVSHSGPAAGPLPALSQATVASGSATRSVAAPPQTVASGGATRTALAPTSSVATGGTSLPALAQTRDGGKTTSRPALAPARSGGSTNSRPALAPSRTVSGQTTSSGGRTTATVRPAKAGRSGVTTTSGSAKRTTNKPPVAGG